MMAKRRTKLDVCDRTEATDNKKKKQTNDNDFNTTTALISPYFRPLADRLTKEFFNNKSCIELSKSLLGQILCRRLSDSGSVLKGRIVETEAYLGVEDKACHTYGGRRTARTEPMFMSPGTCYVYFTYGMYHCFNLSAEPEGSVVLVRAVQPLAGIDCMQRLRAMSSKGVKRTIDSEYKEYKVKMLANGPSKICMAFDIHKDNVNKEDITNSDIIWLERADQVPEEDIVCAKRIGLSHVFGDWTDKPLRFYVKDSEFVSKK